MINDREIQEIADFLTDDPDTFVEAKRKKKLDEVECDDSFENQGPGHEQQKEPRDPGKETHKTTMHDVGKDHEGTLKESIESNRASRALKILADMNASNTSLMSQEIVGALKMAAKGQESDLATVLSAAREHAKLCRDFAAEVIAAVQAQKLQNAELKRDSI